MNDTAGMTGKARVLFVCLGNICRSPMAEGVFRRVAEDRGLGSLVVVDSAGTSSWHTGEPPDDRAQKAVRRNGVDISGLRGRQVRHEDFEDFDLIIAMDGSNLTALRRAAPKDRLDRVRLFLDFAPDAGRRDIPDPYDGGMDRFKHVLKLIESASEGLADHVAEITGRSQSG